MEYKNCYSFDKETKEYKGVVPAFKDPLDGGYNLPANTTFVEVISYGEFEIPVFENEEWHIELDYRQHLIDGEYVGGKPYYDPSKFWWADAQYMTELGDIPEGMEWDKISVPQIVENVVDNQNAVAGYKAYLSNTDYVHNVIAEEPDKAEKYAPVIAERIRVRGLIDPLQEQIDADRASIVETYGEEALNHLHEGS